MRKAYKKLTYADRQTIEHMTEQGAEPKKIAEVTGVHVATIYRELKKGADTEGHYKAELFYTTEPTKAAAEKLLKTIKDAGLSAEIKGLE